MKRWLCLILAVAALVFATGCEFFGAKRYDDDSKLRVHFIDVGQGDATLLESNGDFVLIDAGELDYAEKVVSYIKKQGADRLKYAVVTHPHYDHFGGMRTVINKVDTENFITVETDCDTFSWIKLLKAVDTLGINYLDACVGDTYRFGEATLTILAPNSSGYEDYNNYSVVTRVDCGEISFMLTGDAEKESEEEMIAAKAQLKADVLKCGHHGSINACTPEFLSAVEPSYAIISCGENNDYGHPHQETLQKLEETGCEILRTDTMGTIVASTDGKELTFSTDKGGR